MKSNITANQQRVLNTIKEFQRTHNYIPSYKELADYLGYSSPNSIQQYVKALASKGYLSVEKNYGIKSTQNQTELVNVPLVGRVACGLPILATENIDAYIPVEKKLVKSNLKNYFFLKAHGDSMNKEGIDDQDFLLVERTQTADFGSIVVALIEDEATVKIFKPHKDYVALVPHSVNPKHKPIILSENFNIQGIVRKVFKKRDINP